MNIFSRTWAWFLSLKIWQRIGLVLLILMIVGGANGEDSSEEGTPMNEGPAAEISESPSQRPTAVPTTSPTPESTSTSPIALSPVEFRSSALGDLADLRKDLADLKQRIDEGGLVRLYGNVLELTFNVAQLQAISPSDDYSLAWQEKLIFLEKAIDEFSNGLSEDSVAKSKTHLRKISEVIDDLERFVKVVN